MKIGKEKLLKYVLSIVACVLVIFLIIISLLIKNSNKQNVEKEVEGYAKLIEHNGDVYTFVSNDYNTYTYTGYADMNDFYYDVTCVSKKNEKNEYFLDDALINKKEKIIVDYGVYDDITQILKGKYYKVEKENKYGIIDYKGNIIIPTTYEYITISSIQNENECVFVCELENKYDYINENGKIMMSSDNLLDVSCYNKFNDDYNTIVIIGKEKNRKYFNLISGEEVFKEEKDINFKYNMQIKDKKIIIYNKDMSIKEEIDSTDSYNISANVYYKKYIVLSEMKLLDGKRSNKYTVFDENYNKVFIADNEVFLMQDINEEIYFIVKDENSVLIHNKKGLVKEIESHSFDIKNNEKGRFIVLKRINSNVYDVYDFKGNVILEDIFSYKYSNGLLTVTKNIENVSVDYIFFGKDNLKQIISGENVISDKYVIIENIENKNISIYDIDGKILVENIEGLKELYSDNYIIVRNDINYSVYDINKGKKVFEYVKDDFISKIDSLQLIKLKSGIYSYSGKEILK